MVLQRPLLLFVLPVSTLSFVLVIWLYLSSPYLSRSSTSTFDGSSAPSFPAQVPALDRLLYLPLKQDDLERWGSTCPEIYTEQSNQDQVRGNEESWRKLLANGTAVYERRTQLYRNVADDVASGVMEKTRGEGRGIVTTAGNANTLQNLKATLKMVREDNPLLPVEIFSYPSETPNQPTRVAFEHELKPLRITWRTVEGRKDSKAWKNFQLKPEAILRSSFKNILYIDSDNVPLGSLESLFERLEEGTVEGGAVFWPDLTRDGGKNPIWALLGIHCTRDFQLDSGAILISKTANGGLNHLALALANAMAKDWEFWFSLSGGDKDAFRYAFYALGLPYTRAPHYLSSAGVYSFLPPPPSSSSNQGAQHALPLFVHANLLKHTFLPSPFFKHVKRIRDDLVHQPNEDTLRRIRNEVWSPKRGGLCVDIWLTKEKEGETLIEPWDEVFDGMLKGYERRWITAGGRAGVF
ncbi:glycosyltransferase family 71 protein [Atractiella rhizophila]|nr:glycosyltransferase family 71 protein [Atractiella rhizophila]